MSFRLFGNLIMFTYSINDRNGRPHGFKWLTLVILGRGHNFPNTRLFPIGWIK